MNKIFSICMLLLSCIGWSMMFANIYINSPHPADFLCFGLNFGLTIVWTIELFKDA